jgi:hypothetical protein
MPMRAIRPALATGSVPTAFVFAASAPGGRTSRILALAVSYVLPILLLPIALYLMRRRGTVDVGAGDRAPGSVAPGVRWPHAAGGRQAS